MKLLIPPSFGQRLIACIVLFFPLPTFASSLITLSPSGDGSFLLQGVGIEGAAAFDIALGYDAASLGNPRVVAGSFIAGAMMEANTNIPGTVRIAIIRTAPVTGSGIIATLTFDRKGESVGKITALNV